MTVKCPWCGEVVSKQKYPNHLEEAHYRIDEDGTRTGPYPAGPPEA